MASWEEPTDWDWDSPVQEYSGLALLRAILSHKMELAAGLDKLVFAQV